MNETLQEYEEPYFDKGESLQKFKERYRDINLKLMEMTQQNIDITLEILKFVHERHQCKQDIIQISATLRKINRLYREVYENILTEGFGIGDEEKCKEHLREEQEKLIENIYRLEELRIEGGEIEASLFHPPHTEGVHHFDHSNEHPGEMHHEMRETLEAHNEQLEENSELSEESAHLFRERKERELLAIEHENLIREVNHLYAHIMELQHRFHENIEVGELKLHEEHIAHYVHALHENRERIERFLEEQHLIEKEMIHSEREDETFHHEEKHHYEQGPHEGHLIHEAESSGQEPSYEKQHISPHPQPGGGHGSLGEKEG